MRRLIILIIRGYQYLLSPLSPPTCRFSPSCSNYSIQVLSKYGLIKGGWLSIKRILKCNPWTPGGYDPMP